MSLLLDLLDPTAAPTVVRPALLLLVAALLGRPRNARVFERADGLATVAALFRAREASREVRMQALEFFYFYLMPEAPEGVVVGQRGRRVGAGRVASDASVSDAGEAGIVRSTAEKQALLGKYVPNVQELVDDLAEAGPFGGGGGGGDGGAAEGVSVIRAPNALAAAAVV